jgi:hypothetical protein
MERITLLLYVIVVSAFQIVNGQVRTGTWGDQGNGTYINPILNADYSDPDVIRAGNKYYMVSSEFHLMRRTKQDLQHLTRLLTATTDQKSEYTDN